MQCRNNNQNLKLADNVKYLPTLTFTDRKLFPYFVKTSK